jgi:hypothetical protein
MVRTRAIAAERGSEAKRRGDYVIFQQPIDVRAHCDLDGFTTMPNEAVVHAYRHILRQSLRAIQFSKPARFTLRDRLRSAFRKGSASDFDRKRITNTLEFLQYATKQNGLEHKIVKNLLHVWWNQDKGGRSKMKTKARYAPLA